ncbi:MAG TPA: lasso RiPP family leader peptide-containing protein [Vicinamibacterales bacterium]|nr:lasso RiPP family leader peptide-containing protein [Vicinamibacterales bacterium]
MTERRETTRDEGGGPRDGNTLRRPYEPPQLVSYGSVAKLTRAGGSTQADAGANMMRA